jgi:hypothetical protein
VFGFSTPSSADIFERAKLTPARAKTRRAAYLLKAYAQNNEVAAIKVGYLRSGAWWFRRALLMVLILMVMVCIYVLHRNAVNTAAKTTTHAVRMTTRGGTLPSPHTHTANSTTQNARRPPGSRRRPNPDRSARWTGLRVAGRSGVAGSEQSDPTASNKDDPVAAVRAKALSD